MFHTLAADGRTSSELYASELGKALRAAGVEILDVRPPSESPGAMRGPALAGALRYADRYLWYQARAGGAASHINHIPDHGYGHLAFSLDPRRTVVTFLDAMLLKLAARELVSKRMRWTTLAGHRVSLRAIRRVARVITPSASAHDDFLRFQDYPAERVITIPLAVSPSFRPRACGRPEPDRDLVILHVGHCGFYKNVESILRALPLVSRRLGRPVRLCKVGGSFTPAQRELIAALRIGGSIEHLGMLPEEQLVRVYAAADLLLMPSLHEGFGLPVLEAMASGVPVVAANRGSLPEVVGDAGLLVEPDDLDGIAEAAVRILTDTRLSDELSRRGLERARLFSWDRTATATLDVYRAVCAEAG